VISFPCPRVMAPEAQGVDITFFLKYPVFGGRQLQNPRVVTWH